MATLRDIRGRISSIKSIQKITQAMKMVAASKFRRALLAVESSRPYFNILDNNISKIIKSLSDEYSHPLAIQHKEVKNIAFIIISSDQGMCGSFNANLLKETSRFMNENIKTKYPEAQISVLPIGRKAISFYNKQNYPIISKHTQIANNPDYDVVTSILEPVKNSFLANEIDLVFISYVKFIHIMRQEPQVFQLLPFEPSNRLTAEKEEDGLKYNDIYIFEPDQTSILETLIPRTIDSKFWASILESNASEQAARRVAMDNATSNAGELIKNLNLEYNKLRQASITSEIIEIVSGAEALKG
ncbi:MAG: ATP synthase F1 subunit gamma [Ignavibacteria bacterium GWF2_33_9]|nr:MAG: ATP synthase F1 subunit gamma [Ignavibacteria bacterium GWF2_33_9]